MKLKYIYLALCLVGTVLPYSQFVPFLLSHGLDLKLLLDQLFSNYISGFFGMDVIVSSVAMIIWVLTEGPRLGIRYFWLPIAGNLLVGVSLGLPLFLYLREVKRENTENLAPSSGIDRE